MKINNINIRKLRNVPYKARIPLIAALDSSLFILEAKSLVEEYPNEDHTNLILLTFEKCDTGIFTYWLQSKNINIKFITKRFIDKSSKNINIFDMYTILYFFRTLKNHHLNNIKYSDCILLLEDFIKKANKINSNLIDSYIIELIVEEIPGINIFKMVNILFDNVNDAKLLVIKRIMFKTPIQDPLREKIQNLLDIYDIIV